MACGVAKRRAATVLPHVADRQRFGAQPAIRRLVTTVLGGHGRELREIVEELEVPPRVVRDLWHEWMIDLENGEAERKKSAQEERRHRREQEELREIERRGEQEEKNFATMMAGITAALGGNDK